jgi:2'-hydroxybiphenyl-2-sulfinate desulfinase
MLQMLVKEFRYTICPVSNASFIAANRDEFVKNAFEKREVTPVRLQTLPKERWHVHFTYQDDALFREGGNIPPIWAKAGGAEPVLIGIAFLYVRHYILTRIDADISGVENLRGRKLGVPVRSVAVIDWYHAAVLRGYETALNAKGVNPGEVQFVDLPAADVHADFGSIESAALDEGKVDAIFARFVFAQRLLATGKYKVVYETTADPEYVWPVNNEHPNILTVSRKLAENSPEVVTEYIKQVILAARWAKTHYAETVELFARQLNGNPGEVLAALRPGFNYTLEPSLSLKGLLAVESQKRFLFDHGVISKDFDVEKWADNRFLKTALREIETEKTTTSP